MQRRIYAEEIGDHEGHEITLMGWVHARRDHGKIIFIDLRDRSGIAQIVVGPRIASAKELRLEFVIALHGVVKKRPPEMVNHGLRNGHLEIEAASLEILSPAKELPIPVDSDGYDIKEEMRLKYRYLDLRRERLQKNIALRHAVTTFVRNHLNEKKFIEVETPLLTKTSPEGARDFLVPSRLQPGKFYALPQAPQQYKQLLMIAGIERYYQIAKALRDEDLRGDRQFEHTQIDMEMSFATGEDIRKIVEDVMIYTVESCGKKVLQKPFPVFTHDEAIKKFGADKFDLREETHDGETFAFAWVVDFPLFAWDEHEKRYTFSHNPFSAPKITDEDALMRAKIGDALDGIHAEQYDLVCNGYELGSGGERITNMRHQEKVFELIGLSAAQIEERFGHLIEAYQYGAPRHAGIAVGLDRLIMLLAGESNIREVIAFPMSSGGQTSVMRAPSEVDEKQVDELGLLIKKNQKKS